VMSHWSMSGLVIRMHGGDNPISTILEDQRVDEFGLYAADMRKPPGEAFSLVRIKRVPLEHFRSKSALKRSPNRQLSVRCDYNPRYFATPFSGRVPGFCSIDSEVLWKLEIV